MDAVHNIGVCLENTLFTYETKDIKMLSFVYLGVSAEYDFGA
jgi:hypothetical protein